VPVPRPNPDFIENWAYDFDAIDVCARVASAVEACNGAYMAGAHFTRHRELGATDSLAIVLDLPIGRVRDFVENLGQKFEVGSSRLLRDALLLGESRRVLFVPTALDVELFPVGRSEYDEIEFARRQRVSIRPSGETLVVRSEEDTVLRELLRFFDQSLVAEGDWHDLIELLGASTDYDYLEYWAKRLGVAAMLEHARTESSATDVRR
jgi:hypothetical protein